MIKDKLRREIKDHYTKMSGVEKDFIVCEISNLVRKHYTVPAYSTTKVNAQF